MPIYTKIREAVNAIQSQTSLKPDLGIVLGSGLGSIANLIEDPITLAYKDIPHFHGTSIEGHAGQLVMGKFSGVASVFLQGRFHVYEGYPMEEVVLPTRVLCGLGIQTLVLTNAAGGVNTRFRPGDIMVIQDHLNLMGENPLRGPNLAQLGPRFPDLSEAYAKSCIDVLLEAGKKRSIPLQQGVYAAVLGPTYETPAEIRMLRTLGADAVGMSTVPECIAANHLGVRVAALSLITNLAAGMTATKLEHQDVIVQSKEGAEKVGQLLEYAAPLLIQDIKKI